MNIASYSEPWAAAAFLTAVVPDASPAEIKTALIKTARCDKHCPGERKGRRPRMPSSSFATAAG